MIFHNAQDVVIESDVTIDASAVKNGDGGKVIVWSDDSASFSGEIKARGGVDGGDGGFVETSAKDLLIITGSVNAGADNGSSGQWFNRSNKYHH